MVKKNVNERGTEITPAAAEKLKPLLGELGIKIEVIYKNECTLCGKKFSSKNEKRLDEKLEKHVDEKCATARWMRGVIKILEIMGLKNIMMSDLFYIQDGKFPEGCGRTKPEELGMLNRTRELLMPERFTNE